MLMIIPSVVLSTALLLALVLNLVLRPSFASRITTACLIISVLGGLVFGAYLVFIFLMSLATFSPALNILKAVLVTLIAASSLSSFLYSIYLTFGRKLGLTLNLVTVGAWHFLIPLGVMGAWTLMASIRIYIVAAGILFAIGWHMAEKRKGVASCK